jgi:hypothetical protein
MRALALCAIIACDPSASTATEVAALPTAPPARASDGDEGTYALDVPRTLSALSSEMEDGGEVMLAIMSTTLKAAEITFELDPGGNLLSTSRRHDDDGSSSTTGTWTRDGSDIIIASHGGKPIRCTRRWRVLTCTDSPRTDQSLPIIFMKR